MDALELDVFNVDVLDVDAAVECWTSKPKGYQTEKNISFHSLIIASFVCPLLGFGLNFVFCFFWTLRCTGTG